MELSAKYAYQVYKEKSFSAAAKALNVSQPALSATVSRLEKELGIRIFDRSKIPLSLTNQGIIYIQTVEEILQSESLMQQRLRRLSDAGSGRIRIGCDGFSGQHWLPRICGEFHKKYPDVQIDLAIQSDTSMEKLAGNELDLVVTCSEVESRFAHTSIAEDRLLIAMHKDMPGACQLAHLSLSCEEVLESGDLSQKRLEDLSVFREIPFIPYGAQMDISKRMSRMLGGFKTAFCQNATSNSEMQFDLMRAGLGAAVITRETVLSRKHSAQDILFFAPESREAERAICLVGRHSAWDDPIIQNFIQTAKEVCDTSNVKLCL